MRFQHKVSYFFILVILISLSQIIVEKGVTYRGLIAGSVLCIVTLLLAYTEGSLGIWVAVPMNFMGLLASLILYSNYQRMENLIIGSFQFGIGIACLIIGKLTIRQLNHEAQLKAIASIDSTTDTYTMNRFHEMYGECIDLCDESTRISFILIDLDDFSNIKKKFGYSLTESILHKISMVIKKTIIQEATIYRLGMSELLVMYRHESAVDLVKEGESIREAVRDNRAHFGELAMTDQLSVSIGIGSYPETTLDIKELLNDTYSALRYSKNRGKNNVKVYTDVFRDIEGMLSNDRELEIAVKMILLTVKHKDTYTYEHSIRVADYVYEFARRLGVDSFVAEKFKIAALLHDVGKVNIPMTILNQEGKLTNEEFDIIKQHTRLGSDLTSFLPAVSKYGNIVLSHHERYGGGGYPDGLSGDEIPYGARIITIADSVDAMISQRPYQSARTIEEAIIELRRCSGTQFDPSLVPVFVTLLEERMAGIANESLNITLNYSRELDIQLKLSRYEVRDGICEYHHKCPIYSDKLNLKEGVLELYIKKYCTLDYKYCARYMVTKTLGSEHVTDYLMPNMNVKANELIGQSSKQ